MLTDAAGAIVPLQGTVQALPIAALRVLGWVHLGVVGALACGVAGVLASLGVEWRRDHGATSF